MLDAYLVPEKTVITAKGDSQPLAIEHAASRVFLLTLAITSVVEQESIELSIFASADGTTWDAKPMATLPQKFYAGEYPMLVDLTSAPDAKFVRAHWEVSRWGRGPTGARFEIAVRLREVAPEALREAQLEAQTRR
jgi:hypothetical protein